MIKIKLKSKINISKRKIKTRTLMGQISNSMLKQVHSRFRTSKAPDGTKWQPITYRNGRPLIITGSLRDSIKKSHTDKSATVGTNDIRARLHQLGGTIRAKNHPYLTFKIGNNWIKKKSVRIRARPYIGFNQQMKKKYKFKVLEYFKKEFKKRLGGAK